MSARRPKVYVYTHTHIVVSGNGRPVVVFPEDERCERRALIFGRERRKQISENDGYESIRHGKKLTIGMSMTSTRTRECLRHGANDLRTLIKTYESSFDSYPRWNRIEEMYHNKGRTAHTHAG